MPSTHCKLRRRTLLFAGGSGLALLAGCQTAPPPEGTGGDGTDGPSTSESGPADSTATDEPTTSDRDTIPVPTESRTPPDGNQSYPAPPGTIDAETVEPVVMAYEAAWIENALADEACLESGRAGGIVEPSFEIVDRGTSAVLVEVRHPMTMTGGSSHVDGYTLATYYVSTDRVVRVEGTSVSAPCS